MTKARAKTARVFDGEQIAICFETAIHAQVILTTDEETGEVEVEVIGFTIPSWMTNFERGQATTAFEFDGGATVAIKDLPESAFEALESTNVDIDWE